MSGFVQILLYIILGSITLAVVAVIIAIAAISIYKTAKRERVNKQNVTETSTNERDE